MSDNMQPTDEVLDDELLDAVDTEELEDVEEFDPFEGMSDEELDSCATRTTVLWALVTWNPVSAAASWPWSVVPTPASPRCLMPAMAKGRHHLAGGTDDPPPHARRRQPSRLPAGLCRYPGYS